MNGIAPSGAPVGIGNGPAGVVPRASAARAPSWRTVQLLGVRIDALRCAEAVGVVLASLDAGVGGWVLTPNVDILRRLVRDRGFARLCEGTTLRLADGMPLVWASRVQGTPLPERVAGSELVVPLACEAARRGRSMYLLGGNPGAACGAAEQLRRRFPDLIIAGTMCPPMGFDRDEAQVARVVAEIAATRPDIVLVGLGSPKQERLIDRLRGAWPGAWYFGVGITFSFLSGQVPQAPRWCRRIGLEWAHRLIHEPRRLARRYLVDGLPFVLAMLVSAAWVRIRGRDSASARVRSVVGRGASGACRESERIVRDRPSRAGSFTR